MIEDEEPSETLRAVLGLAKSPQGKVGNVLRVHALRPSIMRGHVVLYRAALHDDDNTLPAWLQETISSHVSILNGCGFSLTNHWANARHLIDDEARADAIEAAMHARRPEDVFEGRDLALMRFAEKLTLRPREIAQQDVDALLQAGLDDGEILEAKQVIG